MNTGTLILIGAGLAAWSIVSKASERQALAVGLAKRSGWESVGSVVDAAAGGVFAPFGLIYSSIASLFDGSDDKPAPGGSDPADYRKASESGWRPGG